MFIQHQFTHKVSPIDRSAFIVKISPLAHQKMMHYVDLVSREIGWLGDCYDLGDGTFLIKDVFLMKQETNSVTTELDPEYMAEFATELMQHEQGIEILSNLKFWGHSHANMGTSPSAQDDNQVEQLRTKDSSYFLRGIANKAGRIEFTLYLYSLGIKIHDVPWALYIEEQPGLEELIAAEIEEKVSEKQYTPPSYGGYGGYGRRLYGSGITTRHIQSPRQSIFAQDIDEDVDFNILSSDDEFNETELYDMFGNVVDLGKSRDI